MLRLWTRLLPCWLWVWTYRYMAKDLMTVEGALLTCVRLDDEFILIRKPTKRYDPSIWNRWRKWKQNRAEAKVARLRGALDRAKVDRFLANDEDGEGVGR